MKLSLVNSGFKMPGSGSVAKLVHRDQEIDWNVKAFDRNRQKTNNLGYGVVAEGEEEETVDPFDVLNLYWQSLPDARQNEIFAVYANINVVFETSNELAGLMNGLAPLIQKLFELHKFEEVSYWVRVKSAIRLPGDARVYATLEENVEKSEQYGSREWPRESTYLQVDYWGLIVLIMVLRTLYPVWGRFMAQVKDEIGSDLKEFYAYKLLSKTSIVNTAEFRTLESYVKHYVPQERIKNASVAGYVSTEDFVPWITGLVVVRRLSLLNFSGHNPQFSLVSSIWSFINQTMKAFEKTVNETIKDKSPEGGSASKDKQNKASNLELIKIKEKITNGDVVALNFWSQNTQTVADIMCKDLPPAILAESINTVKKLESEPLKDAQITLGKWVMAAVISPHAWDHLEKKEVLSLLAVAQAVLWHRKHFELAALLTARVMDNKNTMTMGSPDTRSRITKENQEKLLELYPHVPRAPGRRSSDEKEKSGKRPCVAFESIDLLQSSFSENDWLLTLPISWINAIPTHRTGMGRRFAVPADIKNKLAELAIAIATRSF